jgi:hypothetical protein
MTSDINQNNPPAQNANYSAPPSTPNVGSSAASNALDPFQPGGQFYDPHACAFFQAVQTLITGLKVMNNFLASYSKYVLQSDLELDNKLANKLGELTLERVPPGTGTKTKAEASAVNEHNANVSAMQQYYQAKAKAAQNIETSDISTASGVTSSVQAASTQISQMLQQCATIVQQGLQISSG